MTKYQIHILRLEIQTIHDFIITLILNQETTRILIELYVLLALIT